MVQTWIMAGGAVPGSLRPFGSIASVQLRIIARFTGSRASRGRLSPAAARRAAASRIRSSALIAAPAAGPGPRWR